MTAEEIDAQERAAFVKWRRELASLEDEENLILTPFEKNLEVWRQLWRVLERSHIVIQVSTEILSSTCAYCRESWQLLPNPFLRGNSRGVHNKHILSISDIWNGVCGEVWQSPC